ncbi:unnamed protein product [Acanthosepion pharaonis]|uniref:Uncharacterized protein n=1 Tax=Acanthosepion pharaonis TaxID=158019 RepID=A0A812B3A0_ACAPH|nr:unnamed protein product [Sepia pharaonis]
MLSSPTPKRQPAPDSISQLYIQDISLPSGIDRTKKGINGMQDYSNKSSVKSSHSGNRQWQEETTRQADDDEMVLYPSQYCNPSPSQSNQQQNTEMRPLGETVNYPSDTTIVARVCILRCCNHRRVPVTEGGYVTGQRHLISPPYPANPWSDVAVPTTDMRRSNHPPTPRLQSHPYASAQQMLSSPAPKPRPAPDSVSQMYVQDVALPSGRDKSKRTVRTQGYSSRCSVKSTHNERKDWSEDNTVKPEVVSDVYSFQYCNSSPFQHDQQHITDMGPLEQIASYPKTFDKHSFFIQYFTLERTHHMEPQPRDQDYNLNDITSLNSRHTKMDHCIITDAYTPYCGNFSSIPVVEYTDEANGTDNQYPSDLTTTLMSAETKGRHEA